LPARGARQRRPPFAGRTIHGGAFLLIEEAVLLYRAATACFGRLGRAGALGGRLVLSLFFKAILGVQRVFHFDSIEDLGFAILTGGERRALDRNTLGQLVRAAPTRAVQRFVGVTRPALGAARKLCLSFDEHVVARFTRKFLIPKGFHTIRNKKMRAEKLFFGFDTQAGLHLDLEVTPGNGKLARVAARMLAVLRRRRPRGQMRIVLDAGAANSHAELLRLVDDNAHHAVIVRAPRRVAYRKRWAALPPAAFSRYEEPGRYKRAAPKVVHLAETTTPIRASAHQPPRQVRTVVVREERRRGKDRWHALFVFGDSTTDGRALVEEFRARQHHEQAYRILLHDAYVDTAASGYNKHSKNPDRPGFRKNALTLYAWVAALATNMLALLTHSLPGRSANAHPRTVRRWFLNVPADLYLGNDTLIVALRPRWFRDWWRRQIERLNARRVRLPWLQSRRVVLTLDEPEASAAAPPNDPLETASGVWC
jgi:hypothetical protein